MVEAVAQPQLNLSSPPAPGSTPAAAAPAAAPAPAASSATPPSTNSSEPRAAVTRPDYLPEPFFDPATGIKHKEFGEHYTQLATRDAAEAVRRNALPQKAEDYKIELPKDFQLPQGVEFKLDPAKPEYAKFREIALKRGLDQDTVTDLMGVYAETMVGDETTLQTAKKVEMDKLGANGSARITALNTFLTGIVGKDKADVLGLMMVRADIVQALETLATKFSTQGAASFSQQHRDAGGGDGKIPGYENMTFIQRRVAQDQQRRNAG